MRVHPVHVWVSVAMLGVTALLAGRLLRMGRSWDQVVPAAAILLICLLLPIVDLIGANRHRLDAPPTLPEYSLLDALLLFVVVAPAGALVFWLTYPSSIGVWFPVVALVVVHLYVHWRRRDDR